MDLRFSDNGCDLQPNARDLKEKVMMPLLEKLDILTELPDDASRARFLEALQEHFDTDFYLETYPDIREAGLDPLEHYLRTGWKENRNPSPDFSTRSYLDENPDVAATGDNPFLYHVWTQTDVAILPEDEDLAGAVKPEIDLAEADTPAEPIDPPAQDIAVEAAVEKPRPDANAEDALFEEMDRLREMFDAAFYLSKNPGVAAAGFDPLEHFVRFGWKEGRDPHPDFSVSHYLGAYPDVAATGRNPFLHYVAHGRREGRTSKI